jgi:ABC-type multidrug transport system permease subunit
MEMQYIITKLKKKKKIKKKFKKKKKKKLVRKSKMIQIYTSKFPSMEQVLSTFGTNFTKHWLVLGIQYYIYEYILGL